MSKPTVEKVSIKPSRTDLRVRKPNGQLLNPAGEVVAWSAYWRRRELEKDIERVSTEVEPELEPEVEDTVEPAAPVVAKAKTKPAANPQSTAE